MATIVSFLVTLLLLLVLSRLVNRWLMELLGYRWYRIVLWPGVVAHELSHLLGALLTFTRVTGFSVMPTPDSGGQTLGSVSHAATKNPVTLVLISVFPLLGGSFILWALATLLVPGAPSAAPDFTAPGSSSFSYLGSWWAFVLGTVKAFNPLAWQSWLFAYLSITVGAHLAPSNRDLGYTAAGFTALSILAVIVTWLGELTSDAIGELARKWLAGSLTFFLPLLSYALALLALVALGVGFAFTLKRLNERKVWW